MLAHAHKEDLPHRLRRVGQVLHTVIQTIGQWGDTGCVGVTCQRKLSKGKKWTGSDWNSMQNVEE